MGTKATARAKRTYFRTIGGREGAELWKRHRTAFFLHYIIALRARVAPGFNQHGLEPGQALLGDFELKMQLDIAEQAYQEFKEHNGFHDAMGFKWTSTAARQHGQELKNRIADLRRQILEA